MKGMKEPVIVIGASGILEVLRWENEHALSDWEHKCQSIKASYKKKTSRMIKNEKEYVYTKWYKILDCDASLECIGDKEPDWAKILPPEPKLKELTAIEWKGHLVMEKRDYEANLTYFKDKLVFRIEDCINRGHPLYKNPDKALKGDSVRKGGVSSVRSRSSGETESGVDKAALMKKCQDLWREQEPDNVGDDDEDI